MHGNARSNHQCASAADLNNITPTDIKFGDGGNFTCLNGGADNQGITGSQRRINNQTNNNQGIIGNGSNNTVNSGHQFFPNAAHCP
ncbi:hypothetical protein M378DRAFT_13396 [Amanita muscaria Koide BX008]|uniref:Uncharacterized protein n=1 Tax=Amanita muscaria (strain Koide BX008) TaxID=946122 RepID=A0A0C2T4W1_AMAMK|nr:hypothetical protein M378DRAFT_13396 [Amanita muscaria Koide BX008]